MINVQKNIPLCHHSTIAIGGSADFFVVCSNEQELLEALQLAKKNSLDFYILGQGSNTLFSDFGFRGLVIQLAMKGVSTDEKVPGFISAKSGEVWDEFVEKCISLNLTGLECLSGIPGLVGAAPIQNIGAYGQEISQTMHSLKVMDCDTFEISTINAADCEFNYRHSRFKGEDKNRYIILEVSFQLAKDVEPKILYQELFRCVKSRLRYKTILSNQERLVALRTAVLEIRKMKSMVVDESDENSKSLGSFFLNPIVTKLECQTLLGKYPDMPYFNFGANVKLSAAWLLENSGFAKGFKYKNVGTSENHCLAIINRQNGSQREVLELAELMMDSVQGRFGIKLTPEPNILNERLH